MWRNRAKQKHYLFLFSQNVKKNQAFMILFWQALGFYPFLGRVLCILLGLFRKIFENDAIETQILLSSLMKTVKEAWLKLRFELRLGSGWACENCNKVRQLKLGWLFKLILSVGSISYGRTFKNQPLYLYAPG